jgi:hypothetical protein
MNKLVFGLIATVIFVNGLSANTGQKNHESIVRKKTALYYAGADVSSGWGCAQAGAVLGPLGVSAGAVLGGLCGTTWAYYWDNRNSQLPLKINQPADEFAFTFKNEYERCGYLHNKFSSEFLNKNLVKFNSASEFLDEFYEPLCQMVSKEYKIDITVLKKVYTKESLVKMLNKYTEISLLENDEEIIKRMTLIVSEKSGNVKLANRYSLTMKSLYKSYENPNFKIDEFCSLELNSIAISDEFNKEEKEVIKNSIHILKYSFSLWNAN